MNGLFLREEVLAEEGEARIRYLARKDRSLFPALPVLNLTAQDGEETDRCTVNESRKNLSR